ncbi:MAG: hypothetical protein JWN32_2595 [Solirubrobacterales bacterium]|jgi:hypothetical protein|nr:hypothetical protein [Solirubrobacterales bacterium]
MSNTSVTYLVGACCGVFAVAAFVGLVLVPAVGAYSRLWERVAAAFLSLYVLAAFLGLGVLAGAWIWLWVWPRLF